MTIQMIQLTELYPHPDNPRLTPREDVVEQIAAQFTHLNGNIPMIVRPWNGGYQIVGGHIMKHVAVRAGLSEAYCWVRNDALRCDPFAEVADALITAHSASSTPSFCLHEQNTLTTVNIAFDGYTFTGERICPQANKIDWLRSWLKISMLSDTLALWNVPVDPDLFQWSLSTGAEFLRAADGVFSGLNQPNRYIPKELPDRSSDLAFQEYVGKDCIYFVRAEQLGLIKIGFSANPPKRLAALKTGCPDRLELLNIIPGGQQIEKALHRRFSEYRVRGEWFTPTAELMALIEEGRIDG